LAGQRVTPASCSGGTTIDVVVGVVFRGTASEKPMLHQEMGVLKAYAVFVGLKALIAPD